MNIPKSLQVFTLTIVALIATRYCYNAGMFLAAIFALGICIVIWIFPEIKGRKMPGAGDGDV